MNFDIDYTGNKFASISGIVDGWNYYIEREYMEKIFLLIFPSNSIFYPNIFVLLNTYTRFFIHNIRNYISRSSIELEQTYFEFISEFL